MLYWNLARRIPDGYGVFAIEPRRIAGVPLAHAKIEDMAAFYVEEVRKNQPHGPYLLGGLCAGGVIAYEMASQLVRAGESVELVALLETATPKAPERRRRITEQRLVRLKDAITQARKLDGPVKRVGVIAGTVGRKVVNALIWKISQSGERWWVHARFRLLREVLARKRAWPRLVPELTARQIYDSAQARYVPQPVVIASVVLARARKGEGDETPYRYIYADDTFGWNSLVNEIKTIDVDGGHSTMLQEPFVESLSKALLPYLEQNVQNNP